MSQPARITSIDVLPLLAAGLQKFRADATSALEDLEMEVRRALEWIHHDRKEYWAQEARRAYEAVTQAQLQLQQARTSRRIGGQEPACYDEKKVLEKAKRRFEIAQVKIQLVRRWGHAIDKAVDEFRRTRSQFALWLDNDLPRAVAVLDKMSEALVNYISLEAPADRIPTPPPSGGGGSKDQDP